MRFLEGIRLPVLVGACCILLVAMVACLVMVRDQSLAQLSGVEFVPSTLVLTKETPAAPVTVIVSPRHVPTRMISWRPGKGLSVRSGWRKRIIVSAKTTHFSRRRHYLRTVRAVRDGKTVGRLAVVLAPRGENR